MLKVGIKRRLSKAGKVVRHGVGRARKLITYIWRGFWQLKLGIQLSAMALLIILGAAGGVLFVQYQHRQLYAVPASSLRLLKPSSVDTSKVTTTIKDISYATVKPSGPKKELDIGSPLDSTSQEGYKATIHTEFEKGIDFGDAKDDLGFNIKPLFRASEPKYANGQVFFPTSDTSRVFQTFRKNGIKEDIVLDKAPNKDNLEWKWQLNLGDKLEARLLPDGSVGIFSASPYLYGNLQVSDPKDQQLVDKARKKDKTYQVFAIPAPYIIDGQNSIDTKGAVFKLEGSTLTLVVTGLKQRNYPISIDPSIIINTSSGFATGNDDGMIAYGQADQVTRANVSLGTVAAATDQANAFTTARNDFGSAVWNGYLYIFGGCSGSNCTGYLSDMQYCPIGANGAIGTCTTNAATSYTARKSFGAAVYNGYIYIVAGCTAGASGCTTFQSDIHYCKIKTDASVDVCVNNPTGITTARNSLGVAVNNGFLYVTGGYTGSVNKNDIQYCPINADGSVGTCTVSGTTFTQVRSNHASVIYNGYLYIIGGVHAGVWENDINRCPIKLDGSGDVDTCTQQTGAFTNARAGHSAVTSNGYLYIIGGSPDSGTTAYNTIHYCPLYANGSAGTCTSTSTMSNNRTGHTTVVHGGYIYNIGGATGSGLVRDIDRELINIGTPTPAAAIQQTSAFTNARKESSSVVYNGYLYIIGGYSTGYENDIQYCPINANGSVGTCTRQTSAFTTARRQHSSVVYNGYLYIIGGDSGSFQNDIQYCPINADGSVGTCTQQTSAFTNARALFSSVAHNGYLYIIGGSVSGSPTGCSSGLCNDIQYCPINANGSVGTCTQQTAAFTTARSYLTSNVYNGYLYIAGGLAAGPTYQNDIQYCPINANGSVGTCVVNGTGFTTARIGHTSAIYNGYLYIIGGLATGPTYQNDIQYCLINAAGGSVGACTQQTSAFTTARASHTSVVYNGYLYIIGGENNPTLYNDIQRKNIATSATAYGSFGTENTQTRSLGNFQPTFVYNNYLYVLDGVGGTGVTYCPINTNGSTGTCSTQSNVYTTGRYGHAAGQYNGYMYIAGGYNSSDVYQHDIQYCPINSDGSIGTCNQESSAFNGTSEVAYGNIIYNGYVYLFTGSDAYYCKINTDGSTDPCTHQTSVYAVVRSESAVAFYNGYVYIVAGYTTTTNIQYCPINADHSIGTCTDLSSKLTVARSEVGAFALDGYLYVAGGDTGLTDCDPVVGGTQSSCNDMFYCKIQADGSLAAGACTRTTTAFTGYTTGPGLTGYNGYLYVTGTTSGLSYFAVNSPAQTAYYERVIDLGVPSADSIDSIQFTGDYQCTPHISYATAGSNGVFGSQTDVLPDLESNTVYALSGQTLKRYIRLTFTLNDESCGGNTSISNITVNFTSLPPDAPTLSSPTSGQISLSINPTFQFKTTDAADSYVQYKIEVYQSDCSTPVRTIDQTSSQTGWTGQDAQTSTAYVVSTTLAGSTTASHTYQNTALSYNTTYCWKAAAIDPGGSNSFGAYSATQLFTTNQYATAPTLVYPASGQTGISTTPEFRLYSTDPDGDYIRYKITVYQSNCSTLVRTIDQTSSQTGWLSQSLQSATAYSSGQTAIHTYQPAALSANTTYCWKAAAIDPAGTNTFSSDSATRLFTTITSATPSTKDIRGNVNIKGGTKIGQ